MIVVTYVFMDKKIATSSLWLNQEINVWIQIESHFLFPVLGTLPDNPITNNYLQPKHEMGPCLWKYAQKKSFS